MQALQQKLAARKRFVPWGSNQPFKLVATAVLQPAPVEPVAEVGAAAGSMHDFECVPESMEWVHEQSVWKATRGLYTSMRAWPGSNCRCTHRFTCEP